MKVKFVVIINDMGGIIDKLFGEMMLDRLEVESEIVADSIKLFDLIGIGIMPKCLVNWADYDKVVIICDSTTVVFFLNVYEVINNAELWIHNREKKKFDLNKPDRYKFFLEDQEIIDRAIVISRLKEEEGAVCA